MQRFAREEGAIEAIQVWSRVVAVSCGSCVVALTLDGCSTTRSALGTQEMQSGGSTINGRLRVSHFPKNT